MQTFHGDLKAKFAAARRVSVPIVAINTPDQPSLLDMIAEAVTAEPPSDTGRNKAIFVWDIVRGIYARNEAAKEEMVSWGNAQEIVAATRREPIAALDLARDHMPEDSVLVYCNAQRFVKDAGVCQALLNLRDDFKSHGRMVVMIGTGIVASPEIANDIVQWSEDLPDDDQLTKIVAEQVDDNKDKFRVKPTAEAVKQAAFALRGTSCFGADQLSAMGLRPTGIDLETLHTQARAMIEQTPGLTFERGKETFDDVCGLDFAKAYSERMFNGPKSPAVIVRVEEIEKAMAGAKGDLSGTSGDALQVMLTQMEDNGWSGMLAFGVPGAGKSLLAKTAANTFKAKAVVFDLNACKGSLVGQSEQNIRQAMSVLRTLGGDRVFFVASCNALDTLHAALQRRFRAGVWFFDTPTAEGRAAMWNLHRSKFGLGTTEMLPDEPDLTGADIRNICEQAYLLGCSLKEARRYVVPLKSQSPKDIEQCRLQANGRFTDATLGGVYDMNRTASQLRKAGPRKVAVV